MGRNGGPEKSDKRLITAYQYEKAIFLKLLSSKTKFQIILTSPN
jgi:hypothetical protein